MNRVDPESLLDLSPARLRKRARRRSGGALHQRLNAVAREHGYDGWQLLTRHHRRLAKRVDSLFDRYGLSPADIEWFYFDWVDHAGRFLAQRAWDRVSPATLAAASQGAEDWLGNPRYRDVRLARTLSSQLDAYLSADPSRKLQGRLWVANQAMKQEGVSEYVRWGPRLAFSGLRGFRVFELEFHSVRLDQFFEWELDSFLEHILRHWRPSHVIVSCPPDRPGIETLDYLATHGWRPCDEFPGWRSVSKSGRAQRVEGSVRSSGGSSSIRIA